MPGIPKEIPMSIDFATSFYFHREGPGMLMGMAAPGEQPGFDAQPSDELIPAMIEVSFGVGFAAPDFTRSSTNLTC